MGEKKIAEHIENLIDEAQEARHEHEDELVLDVVAGFPLVKGDLCAICGKPILTKEEAGGYKPWKHGWMHKECEANVKIAGMTAP